jgi:CRISPR-associated protein Csm2
MPRTVFSFAISELDSLYRRDRGARDREVKILKEKFSEWELDDRATIKLTSDSIQAIITDSDNTSILINWAQKLGYILKALQLSTSQIRNIFGTVRRIEMDWGQQAEEQQWKRAARQLALLQPKLAYQAGRVQGKGKEGVQELANVLIPSIDLVGEDRARFQNFVDFFEAILAYHTAAGGQQ